MPRLPILSGREMVRILSTIGYKEVRRQSSHIRLSHSSKKSITIPDYKDIGRGLLRKILRDAEITPQEFEELLK